MTASLSVCGRRIVGGSQQSATGLYRVRNGRGGSETLEPGCGGRERWCVELADGKVETLQGEDVQQIQDGQCGLCVHFGESHPRAEQLISIRKQHEAPEVLIDECGHPRHAPLHLMVTPISGCDGFERAVVM